MVFAVEPRSGQHFANYHARRSTIFILLFFTKASRSIYRRKKWGKYNAYAYGKSWQEYADRRSHVKIEIVCTDGGADVSGNRALEAERRTEKDRPVTSRSLASRPSARVSRRLTVCNIFFFSREWEREKELFLRFNTRSWRTPGYCI